MTSDGNHVADCDTSRVIPDEERLGNARLIAAAPQLLAALESIHEAGRMSDQPRAVYCSLIAQDALDAAGNLKHYRDQGTEPFGFCDTIEEEEER